jgi:hypothetical protein
MKIGPWELTLRAAAAKTKTPVVPEEAGASGTVIVSGFLQSTEYNPSLRGLQGLLTIDQMLRSDGAVQEAIEHIVSPIKNATWDVVAASDDPNALEQAAFIRCAYHKHLGVPWLESLDEQLDYLWYGHAVFEVVFKQVEEALYYADPDSGERVDLPSRQFLTLDHFAPRLQTTLYKWNTNGSELVSVTQRALKNGNYGDWTMPAENLLVLTNKKRGDEWTGRSMLRAAYKHWFAKDLIEKQEIVALERWGVGIPVGYPPDDTDKAAIDRVEQILVDLRGGEHSYIASPGPKQTTGVPGYVWEILSPTGTPPNFTDAINRHRGDIKAAVLARFAELGHSSVGARATGDIQAVVWFSALHAIARYICESHEAVIKRLIDANYAGVEEYPQLVATDIEVRNLVEYATAMAQMVSSGAITMDQTTESAMRAAIDLPEKEEPVYQEPQPTDTVPEQELQPGDPGYQPRPGEQAPQRNGSKQSAPPMPNHPPSGYRP